MNDTALAARLPITLAMRLVVFSDDWGRHPSSCQHLVRRLAPKYRTLWVNTIGMRRVTGSWADLRRGVQWGLKCLASRAHGGAAASGACHGASAGSSEHASHQPQVASPWMWPSFRGGLPRRVNAAAMRRAVRRWTGDNCDDVVILTTLPIAADLTCNEPRPSGSGFCHPQPLADARGSLKPGACDGPDFRGRGHFRGRAVYYCVDDFSVWPGVDGRTMLTMERELLAKVDRVAAVSQVLCDKLRDMGRDDVQLLTHGVDLDHWRVISSRPSRDTAPAPVAVFWGLLDERLDVNWCAALGRALSQRSGKLVLIGPPGSSFPGSLAPDAPGIELHPAVPYAALPALLSQLCPGVLVMPYRDLPVTRAMQPLKFKEYLATGLPVVGRSLPGVAEWADAADLVADEQSFVARVLHRMTHGVDATQAAARKRLAHESWEAKAAALEQLLLSCLADGGRDVRNPRMTRASSAA